MKKISTKNAPAAIGHYSYRLMWLETFFSRQDREQLVLKMVPVIKGGD